MAKMMGASAITNTIYYGNVKDNKWVGKKEDVTDVAIKAVFEWFMNNVDALEDGKNCYEIRFEGVPYVLSMTKEKGKEE